MRVTLIRWKPSKSTSRSHRSQRSCDTEQQQVGRNAARGPLKIAGVEVHSSSRTSTSTRNPRPTPGHPHSTRKSLQSRSRLSPDKTAIRHATDALINSDKSTLTEHTNLPNSLPNLGFIAIRCADVERSQPLASQQLRDANCGNTCLRKDKANGLATMFRSL